jgi:hypothetical protein
MVVEMNTVIELALDTGFDADDETTLTSLTRFAHLVRTEVLEQVPDLDPVISWLENGCNPQDAANELRLYAVAIRALKEKT